MSVSGCQYYLLVIDNYSHFAWTFPLRHKSDVFPTLRAFLQFTRTQFNLPMLTIQTDNGKEFDNSAARALLSSLGTVLRLSYPYTSPRTAVLSVHSVLSMTSLARC